MRAVDEDLDAEGRGPDANLQLKWTRGKRGNLWTSIAGELLRVFERSGDDEADIFCVPKENWQRLTKLDLVNGVGPYQREILQVRNLVHSSQ